LLSALVAKAVRKRVSSSSNLIITDNISANIRRIIE